jgi:hypothetical protein
MTTTFYISTSPTTEGPSTTSPTSPLEIFLYCALAATLLFLLAAVAVAVVRARSSRTQVLRTLPYYLALSRSLCEVRRGAKLNFPHTATGPCADHRSSSATLLPDGCPRHGAGAGDGLGRLRGTEKKQTGKDFLLRKDVKGN